MSYNQEALSVKAKLQRKRKVDNEIIIKLISSPRCMIDEPEKDEVYIFAILYFEGKKRRSVSGEREEPNSPAATMLQCVMNKVDEDYEKHKTFYFKMIANVICSTCEEELKLVPKEIKDKAFEIIKSYLEEICS